MSSNTQDNIDRLGAFETAPGLPSTESRKNTAGETRRTDYDTSPLQYGQGTNTSQYDPSRFGEEGTEGAVGQQRRGQGGMTGNDTYPPQHDGQGTNTTQYDSSRFGGTDSEGAVGQQKQQGRGKGGIGIGHHKSHQEGSTCETGAGGTTDTSQFPSEQSGATTTGYGTGTQAGDTTGRYAGDTTAGSGIGTDNQYPTTGAGDTTGRYAGDTTAGSGIGTDNQYVTTGAGDTTGRYAGDTTAGSGAGTDNQYPTTGHNGEGRHHKHHLAGTHVSSQESEVTGTGVKPSFTEKIVEGAEKAFGSAERAAGRMMSNTQMYERGEERIAEAAKKNY